MWTRPRPHTFSVCTHISYTFSVSDTVASLQGLLDDSKKYVLAEHQEHTYDDKFALVEYMTLAAWRSLADAYEMLGFDLVQLLQQHQHSNDKEQTIQSPSIILYFEGVVKCNFIEERQAQVIGNGHETIKTTTFDGQRTSKEDRTIHRYKNTFGMPRNPITCMLVGVMPPKRMVIMTAIRRRLFLPAKPLIVMMMMMSRSTTVPRRRRRSFDEWTLPVDPCLPM
jgi:hypothetical protein